MDLVLLYLYTKSVIIIQIIDALMDNSALIFCCVLKCLIHVQGGVHGLLYCDSVLSTMIHTYSCMFRPLLLYLVA